MLLKASVIKRERETKSREDKINYNNFYFSVIIYRWLRRVHYVGGKTSSEHLLVYNLESQRDSFALYKCSQQNTLVWMGGSSIVQASVQTLYYLVDS